MVGCSSIRLAKYIGRGFIGLSIGLLLGMLAGLLMGGAIGVLFAVAVSGNNEIIHTAAAVSVIGLVCGALLGIFIGLSKSLKHFSDFWIPIGGAIIGGVVGAFLGGEVGLAIFAIIGFLTGCIAHFGLKVISSNPQ